MATPWHDVLASCALRISALTGTLGPALETAFNVRPLTTTQFQSTVFPFTDVKYALINAEQKLAHAIANTSGHPWRASLAGVTVGIANEGVIPSTSSTGLQVIGARGSVYDATDGTVCTKKPLAVIRRRVRNASSFPTSSNIYHYHIDDRRIYHTRTGVVIDVCIYERSTQLTNINSNGNMLLPDVLGEALICGAVAFMVRDDEFAGQAATYAAYFASTVAMIQQGLTAIPSKPMAA